MIGDRLCFLSQTVPKVNLIVPNIKGQLKVASVKDVRRYSSTNCFFGRPVAKAALMSRFALFDFP
jgi:hypothetical protein